MRFFATKKCRTVLLSSTLFAFGGMTQKLNAQDGQVSSRSDIALFDSFLDAHADLDAQLRVNPSLLTNEEYLEAHPQLQVFLNQHPQVQTQMRQNPSFFMERAKRFDAREAGRRTNPNPDLTRQQVGTMDQFMDKNPEIGRDLWRNPSLVNNAEYLEAHPQLQAFLNQHPNVKEEFAENPRYFMNQEQGFEHQERSPRQNPNPDLTRQQVATMDQFMDKNPEIGRDLWRNPSLVNNAEYLEAHPQLQAFLNQHPNVKEEFAENPRYFMNQENGFERQEQSRSREQNFDRDADNTRRDRDYDRDRSADRDRDANRSRDFDRRSNPDVNNQELASFDQFLDRHQDIAKSLEKRPELVNDRGYLKRHKDLDEFFSEHPAVREEVRENPSSFMRRENQFEARNMDRDRNLPDRDRDRTADRDVDRDRVSGRDRDMDADLNRKELQEMDHFLDKHKNIDKDLQKNPSLVNDHDYLKHHKPLETFLSKNPQVGQEIREHPSAFMQKEARFQERNHRMNNRQPATKPKTKVEEKEQMHTATPH